MNDIDWKNVIAYVLRAIADGLTKEEAASKAATAFSISEDNIINKLKKYI